MDAWLTRLYERDRTRYVLSVFIAVPLGVVVFLGPVGAFFPSHYEGLSVPQYLRVLAVAELSAAVIFAVALLAVRRDIRALTTWTRDRRDKLAPAAREAAFRGPRRLARAVALIGIPIVPVPIALITISSHHTTALDWIELLIGGAVAGTIAILGAWFDLEVALRPIRAELGDPGPQAHRSSLIGRLALIVPASAWFACFAFGYLSTSRDRNGAGHLLVVYAFAFGGTAVSLLAVAPLLQGGVFAPIRDLTRATRAVASGRLDARAPVTATDELGELARSFNGMLDDLRRHERELLESRARVVTAADEARRRVERDLHDGAQQQLVLVGLKLGAARRLVDRDPSRAGAALDELKGDLDRALSELRDLAHGLYPELLASDGLPGALRDAAQRAAIPTDMSCDGTGRYSPEIEAAVYFCCLEALQNASKHAGLGAAAEVILREVDGRLHFEVSDDGVGFVRNGQAHGSGLQNMLDRIGSLGGVVTVTSERGAGTTISGAVPVRS